MAKRPSTHEHQRSLLPTKERTRHWNGFYGDKPNPNLRRFVESVGTVRTFATDGSDYQIAPFDQPIETTKATAIYNMHTYWSKKPHDAIRQYITHYTQPGDLVLDPFCGSGGTALAALLEERKAIAIDRSPAAAFIAANHCSVPNETDLQEAFAQVKAASQKDIDWLYATRCDRCDGPARTTYTVYSQVFQCSRCLDRIALFDCEEIERTDERGKVRKVSICPKCSKRGSTEEISTRGSKFGVIPVQIAYICLGKCKPKRGIRHHQDESSKKAKYFREHDLTKLADIEQRAIPHWYPTIPMIKGFETCIKRDLESQGVATVADLYTKRNLWALASVLSSIKGVDQCQSALLFTLTSILFKASKMMAHNNDGIGRIQKGTYYLPQVLHDVNVWQFMEEALGDMIAGYRAIGPVGEEVLVSTSDARRLEIPDCSIDYVFTDPPYAGKVQYGELNYLWESWLGLDTQWHKDEIVVNEYRGTTEQDWAVMMRQALGEVHRVLKPGRCVSMCYHDTSEGTWALLQDLMAESGFVAEDVSRALFIDSKTKTTNQYFGDKVTKRDLVVNFRKPPLGTTATEIEITGEEAAGDFASKMRTLLYDFLTAYPGATKDRIYDHVVSRMVRAGTMQAHNFDEHLNQIAEAVREPVKKNLFENQDPDLFGSHEVVRWYLKSTQLDVVDSAESAKEDHAADKLRRFIENRTNASPWLDGVHYSDLFEHFIYSVHDKPRRPMIEWLLDYFYKTESGTYRLPSTDEEARLKAEGRSKGTSRRIKRYLAFLEQGVAIPTGEQQNDSTLADWIRHAKLSGMYEAGKMLFERGGLSLDRLSEEAAVNVEEDYQVCVRMISRLERS